MKPLFINAPSPTARFAICAILSFLCVSIDHNNDHLSSIRSTLSMLVYPVQVVVNTPVDAGIALSRNLSSRVHLATENERLRAENLRLSQRAQRYSALQRENERLRELLDSSVIFDDHVIVADVLAVETTASERQIVIDKGSNQGVFVGQPLLDAYGVIGQVSHIGPFSATALLITDPRHALPVLINRNGLRAIAVGAEEPDVLELSFVSGNADIKIGDLVVTSGLGRTFPAGYPVGVVNDIQIVAGESFTRVEVEPSGRVGHSREVLLIGKRPPVDPGDPTDPAERLSAVNP